MASKDMTLEDRLQAAAKTKQPRAEDRLARLYKRENEILDDVKGTWDTLKRLMSKIRSDGVKENVDKLGGLFEMLERSREAIKLECRVLRLGIEPVQNLQHSTKRS